MKNFSTGIEFFCVCREGWRNAERRGSGGRKQWNLLRGSNALQPRNHTSRSGDAKDPSVALQGKTSRRRDAIEPTDITFSPGRLISPCNDYGH